MLTATFAFVILQQMKAQQWRPLLVGREALQKHTIMIVVGEKKQVEQGNKET